MKLNKVLPIILITLIWYLYLGVRQGMDYFSIFGSVLGGLLAIFGIPYLIAELTIKKTNVDYQKRRFNRFIIIWSILIFLQVIVQFNEK
jgi:Ca2+/H+ antiporter